ncbi:Regulator of nonsense transcripts UPF2 [Zancudomyces culisetae]|uniref:Regulator of nonsense transcripts UPF2 n=1 Tax=Zancudomyces culisetae TaxID=1213189 RepID=A0A1R1PS46_ZANCU|nr:Regulator of nonsense transcripts UPF2 [Zancudomyces culisetae]|eukprot:OMH83713.1 Regulator of nonsense transcripts UPF2 [Zancudomyces culisetae]
MVAEILSRIHGWFGVKVVDNVMESVRIGLENRTHGNNQKIVSEVKYLGELFGHRMISPTELFELCYMLMNLGYERLESGKGGKVRFMIPVPGRECSLDPSDDYFRVRLMCVLLKSCSPLFSTKTEKIQLMVVMLVFQLYVLSKQQPTPLEVSYFVQDLFDSVMPLLPSPLVSAAEKTPVGKSKKEKKRKPIYYLTQSWEEVAGNLNEVVKNNTDLVRTLFEGEFGYHIEIKEKQPKPPVNGTVSSERPEEQKIQQEGQKEVKDGHDDEGEGEGEGEEDEVESVLDSIHELDEIYNTDDEQHDQTYKEDNIESSKRDQRDKQHHGSGDEDDNESDNESNIASGSSGSSEDESDNESDDRQKDEHEAEPEVVLVKQAEMQSEEERALQKQMADMFDTELNKLVMESLDGRKLEKVNTLDISIPMQLREQQLQFHYKKSTSTSATGVHQPIKLGSVERSNDTNDANDGQEKDGNENQENIRKFSLLLGKKQKPVIKNINVPDSSYLAIRNKAQMLAAMQEKQKLKQLVLKNYQKQQRSTFERLD